MSYLESKKLKILTHFKKSIVSIFFEKKCKLNFKNFCVKTYFKTFFILI